jgi:hypothetical protein
MKITFEGTFDEMKSEARKMFALPNAASLKIEMPPPSTTPLNGKLKAIRYVREQFKDFDISLLQSKYIVENIIYLLEENKNG